MARFPVRATTSVRRAGRGFDVNLFKWNVMSLQKALGYPAVRAPGSGIDDDFHIGISLRPLRDYLCVLCGKAFDRKERKGLRKVRKENKAASVS